MKNYFKLFFTFFILTLINCEEPPSLPIDPVYENQYRGQIEQECSKSFRALLGTIDIQSDSSEIILKATYSSNAKISLGLIKIVNNKKHILVQERLRKEMDLVIGYSEESTHFIKYKIISRVDFVGIDDTQKKFSAYYEYGERGNLKLDTLELNLEEEQCKYELYINLKPKLKNKFSKNKPIVIL